jgi:regulatory protein
METEALLVQNSPVQNNPAQNSPAQNSPAQNNDNAVDQVTEGQLRFAALSLLARREHSRYELKQKLSQRFPQCPLIDSVLQQLADEALQSDSRFAEAFVAMRARKGQGPVRIEKELEQRRVNPEVIARTMEPYADQWQDLAYAVCSKKYARAKSSAKQPSALERAKQGRFLLYRGFTSEQIQGLWKSE